MRTEETPWLNRKTWRRLVELHATGRISRAELARLKILVTRGRARPAPAAVAAAPVTRLPPRLTLLRGGDDSTHGPGTPSPPTPSPREVA